jgi:hypothetical protein
MPARKSVQLPADLLRLRQRFDSWRATRSLGARIPKRLWVSAVRIAGVHGLCRTASMLGLDYYSLKKRIQELEESDGTPRSGQTTFVELPSATLNGRAVGDAAQCLIELTDEAGVRMRIHLSGCPASDMIALSRGLWEGERCCR